MLTARLAARCSSAKVVGKAFVEDYRIEFTKVSKDGSGKATLQPFNNAKQYGVLFEIDRSQRQILDRIEGLGVGYKWLELDCVTNCSNRTICSAYSYQATDLNPNLKPFDWYLALVVAGAEQHELPTNYISTLREIKYEIDPEPKPEILKLLKSHGIQKIDKYLSAELISNLDDY